MPVTPREAATVVLVRERPEAAPEFLMVRRHERNATAGGAFVFPGGLVDADDWGEEALRLCEALDAGEAAAMLRSAASPQRALGHFFAAVRESFEEVGVLLARDGAGRLWRPGEGELEQLRAARAAMRAGELKFAQWLASRGLRPAVGELAYYAHWITPEAFPRRFDTRFFLCPVDAGAFAEPDLAEVVECRWIAAAEALGAWRRGEFQMVNATIKNLELLAPYASIRQMREALCGREVPSILPKVIPEGKGYRVINPWEPGYEEL